MFHHTCDGTTQRYSWSDDSYSAGSGEGPCPALRGKHCEASNCPSNNKRKEQSVPQGNVKVKISIPIEVGGYTGQRDAWESHERDYNVALDGDKVVLEEASLSSIGRKITFEREALETALEMLSPRAPAKPLYRNGATTGAEALH